MKNYQIESMKLASQVLRTCHARLDLEDAIFEGPGATPLKVDTLIAATAAIVGLGTWFMVLMAMANKL